MSSSSTTGGPGQLRVYHLALQLCAQIDELLATVRCPPHLAQQIRRCVDSLLLNIAEGAGHAQPGKKIYHFQIAHGESYELIAGLNRIEQLNPTAHLQHVYQTTTMTGKMLKSLIVKWESQRE